MDLSCKIEQSQQYYEGLAKSKSLSNTINKIVEALDDEFESIVNIAYWPLIKQNSKKEKEINYAFLSGLDNTCLYVNIGKDLTGTMFFLAFLRLTFSVDIPFCNLCDYILENNEKNDLSSVKKIRDKYTSYYNQLENKCSGNAMHEVFDYINRIKDKERLNKFDEQTDIKEILCKLYNFCSIKGLQEFLYYYAEHLFPIYTQLRVDIARLERDFKKEGLFMEVVTESIKIFHYLVYIDFGLFDGKNTLWITDKKNTEKENAEVTLVIICDEIIKALKKALCEGPDAEGHYHIHTNNELLYDKIKNNRDEIIQNVRGLSTFCLNILLLIRLRRVLEDMTSDVFPSSLDSLNAFDVREVFYNSIGSTYDFFDIEKIIIPLMYQYDWMLFFQFNVTHYLYSLGEEQHKIIAASDKIQAVTELYESGYFKRKLSGKNLEAVEAVFCEPKVTEYLSNINKVTSKDDAMDIVVTTNDVEDIKNERPQVELWKIPNDFFSNPSIYVNTSCPSSNTLKEEVWLEHYKDEKTGRDCTRIDERANMKLTKIIEWLAKNKYIGNTNKDKNMLVLAISGLCPDPELPFESIKLYSKDAISRITVLVECFCSGKKYVNLSQLFAVDHKWRGLGKQNCGEFRGFIYKLYGSRLG